MKSPSSDVSLLPLQNLSSGISYTDLYYPPRPERVFFYSSCSAGRIGLSMSVTVPSAGCIPARSVIVSAVVFRLQFPFLRMDARLPCALRFSVRTVRLHALCLPFYLQVPCVLRPKEQIWFPQTCTAFSRPGTRRRSSLDVARRLGKREKPSDMRLRRRYPFS